MRCKPGQMAWISKVYDPCVSPNIGKVVQTIRIVPELMGLVWEVDAPPGLIGSSPAGICVWQGGRGLVVDDDCLTPINDPDMDVDTTTEKELVNVR